MQASLVPLTTPYIIRALAKAFTNLTIVIFYFAVIFQYVGLQIVLKNVKIAFRFSKWCNASSNVWLNF